LTGILAAKCRVSRRPAELNGVSDEHVVRPLDDPAGSAALFAKPHLIYAVRDEIERARRRGENSQAPSAADRHVEAIA
jgi:hypothetical protein